MGELATSSPYYAAIDLGSNSFHLWIVKKEGAAARTVTKSKRKVRLAAGLQGDGELLLDDDAFARGLACLALFAQEIAAIPKENIICVATAALRQAANQQQFLTQGQAILGAQIQLISGEQEAALIYQGASEFAGIERIFH
ncbi:MAG: guanosine-5'-triphosphate,3'-diphosphate pyrophosphatase, partial [Enterovibrio sp.]